MFINLSLKEYETALNILNNSSKHYKLVFNCFKEEILKQLNRRKKFLDVGAGAGIITEKIIPYFESTTAIEPNHEFKKNFLNLNCNLIVEDFFKIDLCEKYDFILCSHVMYHMPLNYMVAFIKKILSYLETNGTCLIALMAPRGESHKLHYELNSDYINSSQVINILNNNNINFSKIEATNEFVADTYEEMLSLCRFFAYEDCIPKEKLDLLNKKEKELLDVKIQNIAHQYKTNDFYTLKQEEDYFLISN